MERYLSAGCSKSLTGRPLLQRTWSSWTLRTESFGLHQSWRNRIFIIKIWSAARSFNGELFLSTSVAAYQAARRLFLSTRLHHERRGRKGWDLIAHHYIGLQLGIEGYKWVLAPASLGSEGNNPLLRRVPWWFGELISRVWEWKLGIQWE